ncbi:MAG: hypothetical protein HYX39_10255 [Bacteroidetes bacterium]|nr:hypothetical protein [Bacteroidota bacterium]
MKKHFLLLFIAFAGLAVAQPEKKGAEPKMAPTLAKGYYLNLKGDSVRGEIQTNPESELEFYKNILFKAPGSNKVTIISPKKAKGYGFNGRHFVIVPYDSQTQVYVEQLVNGRLNFFEYKYGDSKEGKPVISNSYYIQDTQADEKNADLKELKTISPKFYKKELKPYMKDQPTTWADLDKFTFNRETVVKALKEFNKYYEKGQ